LDVTECRPAGRVAKLILTLRECRQSRKQLNVKFRLTLLSKLTETPPIMIWYHHITEKLEAKGTLGTPAQRREDHIKVAYTTHDGTVWTGFI
jgi:hypothetical protein